MARCGAWVAFVCHLCVVHGWSSIDKFTEEATLRHYRERVRSMFQHAYNGYMEHAFPYDELMPLSCKGTDTWGSFSLSLIDSLDTLLIMGNTSEFLRASELVLQRVDADANVNVSVFETNIRVIGGLLSAHMLYARLPEEHLPDGWPCDGPLLRLAARFADRLLPAFHTATGMPYGTVNLRHGVHNAETPVTCTAGVGTFIVEFGALTTLTGNPNYERVARRASDALWKYRSSLGLVGNHINVQTGQWTATDAGIGAGVDSYFEYLLKASALFGLPELRRQFDAYLSAIAAHVQHDDWFFWVSMDKAHVSMPYFQSLEAFWPGALVLAGRVDVASRIMLTYGQLLRQYGFPPEFYNVPNQETVAKRAGYPLRPEMAESLLYLYRATRDPTWLRMAASLVEAIEHSAKTACGYATVQNVKDHTVEDRMESFFLAETTKYLYLLFDQDNFMHNDGTQALVVETTSGPCAVAGGGYVFNTEAHPVDPAVLYCCSQRRQHDKRILENMGSQLDMVALMQLDGTNRGCDTGTAPQAHTMVDLPRGVSELLQQTKEWRDEVDDGGEDEDYEQHEGQSDDGHVEIDYETVDGEKGSVLVKPPAHGVKYGAEPPSQPLLGARADDDVGAVATAATMRAIREIARLQQLQTLLSELNDLESAESILSAVESHFSTPQLRVCRQLSSVHMWLRLVNSQTCDGADGVRRSAALIYGINLVANEVKRAQIKVVKSSSAAEMFAETMHFGHEPSEGGDGPDEARGDYDESQMYNRTVVDVGTAAWSGDRRSSAGSVELVSLCGRQSALALARAAANTVRHSHALMSCRLQPFLSRFSASGQVIPARLARLDQFADEIGA